MTTSITQLAGEAHPTSAPFSGFRNLVRLFLRVVAALMGPCLLGYLVYRVGPSLIWKQAHGIGWGLLAIILLGGLPQLVRTWSWRQAFTCDIAGLSWSRSLGSQLVSDAIGQLGIAGKLLGEGVRVSLLGAAVPLPSGISACAIDAGMHAFTAILIAISGITVSLAIAPLSGQWRVYALLFPAVLIATVIAAAVAMANRLPLVGKGARAIGRLPGLDKWIGSKLPVIDSAEQNLLTFYRDAPGAFWACLGISLLWHGLAVSEVYLILRFMGIPITAIGALAMEGLTKVINLVGAASPGNVGTYEGGNMMIAQLFGVTGTAGLTLALCRRARALFWAGIGAVCMPIMKRAAREHEGKQHRPEIASILSHANIELLSLLGKLTELRGGDTAGHTLRVTVQTLLFAERLQLPVDTVVRAVDGAFLHDVGKLVMPDRVIDKHGSLTAEERVEMQSHVLRGLDIINESELLKTAVNVVAFHHERYDGRGYPQGVAGEQIPLEARLFALVDVFDALTASRVYKPALSVSEALEIMTRERGSHFDPSLFDCFVEMAGSFERLPREGAALKAMLLDKLSPYLAVSEISYLRHKLQDPGKVPAGGGFVGSKPDTKIAAGA